MHGMMVLVDTSVFVAHFRGKNLTEFKQLLINDQIFLSPFVSLELLQGVRKNEMRELTRVLGGLPVLKPTDSIYPEAERILAQVKGHGISMGIVDLLLCAQANLERCPVYSFDSVFAVLARRRLIAVL